MDRGDLPGLALFETVARCGGFRAAARRLGMSPSAVSHAIGQLEAQLGVRLFNRTTRSVAITVAGRRLLDRLAPALDMIADAVRDAGEAEGQPIGTVRLTAPHSAIELLIAPHAARFARAFPDIVLDIVAEDRFVDIVAEGYDAGIRLGERLQPDMIAVRIGPAQRLTIVAAPAYLERYGMPATLEDLAGHRCLMRRFTGGGVYHWEVVRDGADVRLSNLDAVMTSNDDALLRMAARDGAGLWFGYEAFVVDDLASGRLVEVLPRHCTAFPGFFLYHTGRRQVRPALRAVIDFLVTANRTTGAA